MKYYIGILSKNRRYTENGFMISCYCLGVFLLLCARRFIRVFSVFISRFKYTDQYIKELGRGGHILSLS